MPGPSPGVSVPGASPCPSPSWPPPAGSTIRKAPRPAHDRDHVQRAARAVGHAHGVGSEDPVHQRAPVGGGLVGPLQRAARERFREGGVLVRAGHFGGDGAAPRLPAGDHVAVGEHAAAPFTGHAAVGGAAGVCRQHARADRVKAQVVVEGAVDPELAEDAFLDPPELDAHESPRGPHHAHPPRRRTGRVRHPQREQLPLPRLRQARAHGRAGEPRGGHRRAGEDHAGGSQRDRGAAQQQQHGGGRQQQPRRPPQGRARAALRTLDRPPQLELEILQGLEPVTHQTLHSPAVLAASAPCSARSPRETRARAVGSETPRRRATSS